MTASLKLRAIESKISALKAQQEQLLQQQAQAIAQMIMRLDLGQVEMTILAGNLLAFRGKIKTNAPEVEDWHRAGEKFLRRKRCESKSQAPHTDHQTTSSTE